MFCVHSKMKKAAQEDIRSSFRFRVIWLGLIRSYPFAFSFIKMLV